MAALKVLHEVSACIYKGEEKPVMKWSFHDSQGVYTVDVNGILTEVLSPTLEDDLIVFNEEEYHCGVIYEMFHILNCGYEIK